MSDAATGCYVRIVQFDYPTPNYSAQPGMAEASKRDRQDLSPDGGLTSLAGVTRDGQPLSLNRAPIEALQPYVCRIYATRVEADDDNEVSCGIFSDMPALRFIFAGEWCGKTVTGPFEHGRGMFFYGPQSKRMPASVRGGFSTVTIQFQPGAIAALGGPDIEHYVDRIVPLAAVWPETNPGWIDDFDPQASLHDWLELAEACLMQVADTASHALPNEITRSFDHACLMDPNLRITDFAEHHEVSSRTVTRLINRDFGLPPKKVLQRARALDLAATLRGIVEPQERDVAALRYYDQSHMIREFSRIFDMTPHAFSKRPQPILTMTLETRQARRLEAIRELQENALPSWRDPEAEPKAAPTVSRTAS